MATIKKNGPTKEMLTERAADLGIEVRSSMNKDELLEAIGSATDENGKGRKRGGGLDSGTGHENEHTVQQHEEHAEPSRSVE